MNRKNKIIFFSVYFVAMVVTIVHFLKDRDLSTSTISKLLIILLFQLLLFLFIYFGSQKKLVFRKDASKGKPKLTKEMGVLRVFLICSLVFCGLRILMQCVYLLYPMIAGNKASEQTDHQNLLERLIESAPKGNDALLEIIVGSVSLVGIFLIWKMKKLGFCVFILAEGYFYYNLACEMIDKHVGLLGAIVVGWEMMWPVWDLVFMVMCAGQLKHMTWKLKPLSADATT